MRRKTKGRPGQKANLGKTWGEFATLARQPRASPVWQMLHDHAATLPGLSPAATGAIEAFPDCGDLHAGFIRSRCPDCGHEFLRALVPQQEPWPPRAQRPEACGADAPTAPAASADFGRAEFFGDNCAEPAAADREPVFWPASGGPVFPADNSVQADATEST